MHASRRTAKAWWRRLPPWPPLGPASPSRRLRRSQRSRRPPHPPARIPTYRHHHRHGNCCPSCCWHSCSVPRKCGRRFVRWTLAVGHRYARWTLADGCRCARWKPSAAAPPARSAPPGPMCVYRPVSRCGSAASRRAAPNARWIPPGATRSAGSGPVGLTARWRHTCRAPVGPARFVRHSRRDRSHEHRGGAACRRDRGNAALAEENVMTFVRKLHEAAEARPAGAWEQRLKAATAEARTIIQKESNMTSTSKSWTIATTLAISLVIGGVIGGSVLIPVPANAQAGKADQMNADQYIQLVRRDLRQDKRELIGHAMKISQPKADAFWPVYTRYETNLNKLGDEKLALINDYAANFKAMTDAKAGELTDRAVDLDLQRTGLLRNYLPEFRKTLTNRRVAQFYQVEMPLLKIIDLQIASQLPAMP